MRNSVNKKNERIASQVDSLMRLAMANREKLHICVEFKPHVNWLKCDVISAAHDYKNYAGNSYLLFNEYVRLIEDDAVEQLLVIEDKIIELLGKL